jgi:DNA-directed RNA polymerase subunit L
MEVFTFENEDHTLGVLLQQELLENRDVVFAGYIAEHPLEKVIKLKIQTKMDQMDQEFPELLKKDAESENVVVPPSPREVLRDSINNLIEQLDDMKDFFEESFNA